MIRCSICGDEIGEELIICPGCGAHQVSTKKKEPEDKESVIPLKSVGDFNSEGSTKVKSIKKGNLTTKEKTLSRIQLVYLIIGLFLVGSFLLIASGILETPIAGTMIENQVNSPHAGIDLSSLEQIKKLESRVDSRKDDFTSLLQLAHLLNDSGFKEKAIDRYKQYLKTKFSEPDVWVDMGVCYYELEKNEEAVNSMEKAIKLNPNHQIAHLNLGIVNFSLGNKEKALNFWKKAVALDPNSEVGKRAQELINQH
jgi:tetratricopeptide (TPR) repeat protein